jgi:hypothetical protein
MSSAVVSTSAALGRPFLFDAESEPEVRPAASAKKPASNGSAIAQVVQSTIKNQQSTIPPCLCASVVKRTFTAATLSGKSNGPSVAPALCSKPNPNPTRLRPFNP